MSTPSGLGSLDNATLRAVSEAAVSAELSRDVLLGHLPPGLSALLPQVPKPKEQIFLDVCSLAKARPLKDGTVPLRTWLETAAHFSTHRQEELEIFQRALERLAPHDLRLHPSSSIDFVAVQSKRFARWLALPLVVLLGISAVGWRWFTPQSSSSSTNMLSASALPSASLVPIAVVNVATPPETVPAIASSAPSTAVPAIVSAAPSSPRVEPPKSPIGAAVPTRTSSGPPPALTATSTRYTDGVLKGN